MEQNKKSNLTLLKRESKNYESFQEGILIAYLNTQGYSFALKRPERTAEKTFQYLTINELYYKETALSFGSKINEFCEKQFLNDMSPDLSHSQFKIVKRRKDLNRTALSFSWLIKYAEHHGVSFTKRKTKIAKKTVQLEKIIGMIIPEKKKEYKREQIEVIGKDVQQHIGSLFDKNEKELIVPAYYEYFANVFDKNYERSENDNGNKNMNENCSDCKESHCDETNISNEIIVQDGVEKQMEIKKENKIEEIKQIVPMTINKFMNENKQIEKSQQTKKMRKQKEVKEIKNKKEKISKKESIEMKVSQQEMITKEEPIEENIQYSVPMIQQQDEMNMIYQQNYMNCTPVDNYNQFNNVNQFNNYQQNQYIQNNQFEQYNNYNVIDTNMNTNYNMNNVIFTTQNINDNYQINQINYQQPNQIDYLNQFTQFIQTYPGDRLGLFNQLQLYQLELLKTPELQNALNTSLQVNSTPNGYINNSIPFNQYYNISNMNYNNQNTMNTFNTIQQLNNSNNSNCSFSDQSNGERFVPMIKEEVMEQNICEYL